MLGMCDLTVAPQKLSRMFSLRLIDRHARCEEEMALQGPFNLDLGRETGQLLSIAFPRVLALCGLRISDVKERIVELDQNLGCGLLHVPS